MKLKELLAEGTQDQQQLYIECEELLNKLNNFSNLLTSFDSSESNELAERIAELSKELGMWRQKEVGEEKTYGMAEFERIWGQTNAAFRR